MSNTLKLSSPLTSEFWEIPILFEDDHLLALSKPAGMLTAPDPLVNDRPDLMKLLHDGIASGKPWATERGLILLLNASRLDLETTGVVLLAKTREVHDWLLDLMGTEKTTRIWLALVQGAPEESKLEIKAKLAPDLARPGLMRIDAGRGKRAQTLCQVIETFSRFTLLRCELATDRAHQARLHLRYARLPVVGDRLYGGRPLLLSQLKSSYRLKEGKTERPLISRAALHAETLNLPHPVTGENVSISDPLPKDLQVALKYLRRYAQA